MQLLVSLGRVLVGKGLKPLAALVPFGGIILEIAQDTWEDYSRNVAQCLAPGVPGKGGPMQPATVPRRVETDLRAELESLARATPAAVRQQVEQVAEQVAGDQPPEVRQALANYLAQVPAMLRRSTRRPSDPTGTTLPGNLLLRKGEDLVALLPPRPPRFNAGDRPLPGVDWVLDELLGVGGFGEVWKAHHAQLKGLPPVALKFCLDEQAAKALRNEAGVLDQVMQHGRHEGIVQLRQAYLQAATPCLEYEYIAGGDLAGLIQEMHQKARPSADMAGKIMRRLAAIIGTVHQQRPPIVHRDLKPANILVQKSAAGKIQFKVADFGIGQVTAREAIQTSTSGGDNRAGLLTALVQGSYTPLYASPQQVRGDPADPRDDVYSLGVIWYQLLTGDLGSGAPSGMRWSRDLAQGGMPQSQIDLLASCFESNPAHRPVHAAVLAEQLSGFLGENAPAPPAIPAATQPPPVPQPAKSSSEPPWVLPCSAAEKQVLQDVVVAHPEDRGSFPDAAEARRQGDTAALWFLRAGIANLAVMAGILGLALYVSEVFSSKARLGQIILPMLFVMLFPVGLPGAAAACHFLASGSLKNFRGKAKVTTAIFFGFFLGLLCAFGAIGLGGVLTERGSPQGVAVCFFLFLVTMPTSFVNFFAAIRGILVLKNPAVSQEFGRPENTREELRPVFSKKLVIELAGFLAGLFFIVLLLAFATGRPTIQVPGGGSVTGEGNKGDMSPVANRVWPPATEGVSMIDPGTLADFAGQFGTRARFRVTGATGGFVYGSDPYTLDSRLATVAVHAGALKVGQSGIIEVEIIESPPAFTGSTANGVTTSPYGPWNQGAFHIKGVTIEKGQGDGRPLLLPEPGNLNPFAGQVGTKLAVRVTGGVGGLVYGSGPYSVDSNLAAAAVHAGVLKVGQTGVVEVEIIASPPDFAGATAHGVTSLPWSRPSAYGAFHIKGAKIEQ